MVSSPIGGFMPIPLAMMPAFMAYQSILMGDSFGQAYQYGKRKISAMTNDDFNKLTISKLFEDSQKEYDRMIPSLKQSMQNSQELQGFIVKELLAIIPNLIKDAFGGTSDQGEIDSPFFKNTQATQQQPTNIRYTTDRNPVFNEPAIQNFSKAIDPLLQQRGTKQQTASEREAIRAYNRNQLDTRIPEATPKPIPVTTRKATSSETEANLWNAKLLTLQTDFKWLTGLQSRQGKSPQAQRQSTLNKRRDIASKIRQMSNDYRHPNNTIRNSALRLRQEIANGNWKT